MCQIRPSYFLGSAMMREYCIIYEDTDGKANKLFTTIGSCVTHVLHTAWISNGERVLYNDTGTLLKAAKSFTRFICDTRSTYSLDQQ